MRIVHKIKQKELIMTKIIININNHKCGRPEGSTKSYLKVRNGAIIKAYRQGMRKKVIASLLGLSLSTVYAVLKDNK